MIIIKFSSILTKTSENCFYIVHVNWYFLCTFSMLLGWWSYLTVRFPLQSGPKKSLKNITNLYLSTYPTIKCLFSHRYLISRTNSCHNCATPLIPPWFIYTTFRHTASLCNKLSTGADFSCLGRSSNTLSYLLSLSVWSVFSSSEIFSLSFASGNICWNDRHIHVDVDIDTIFYYTSC